jgi:ER membrane protein complex subunit 7
MRSSMRRKRFSRSTPLLLAAVLFCALCVSSSFLQVQAAALKGQIAANDNLPDLLVLGPHTKASLRRIPTAGSASSSSSHPAFGADTSSQAPQASVGNNARDKYTTYVKREGTFIFPDVAPGAYVLDIQSRWHAFPTYRVDVAAESKDEESNPAGAPNYRTLMRGGPIKVRTHVP